MNNIQIIIHGFILLWFVAVITHALMFGNRLKVFYFFLRTSYKCPYVVRYIFHFLLYYYNKIKEPTKMRIHTREIIKYNASVK